MKPSTRFTLNRADIQKWTTNLIDFLKPLGVIYFGALVVLLQTAGHRFAVTDLMPSTFTLGAMVLYVANAAYDLSRKYLDGKTPPTKNP